LPDVEGGILPPGIVTAISGHEKFQSRLANREFSAARLGSPAPRQAKMPAATAALDDITELTFI
jgi:hypothetical protein